MNTAEMALRWFRLFPEGEDAAVFHSFCEVRELHEERHRRYHVFRGHIGAMLAWLEQYFPDADPEVAMAVFLHDVVCNPRRDDNEERSAGAARVILPELGTPEPVVLGAMEAIISTHNHIARTPNAAKLCDLDLISLGLAPEVYVANTAKLRQEYAHESDQEWTQRQRRFVESMLGRPQIYTFIQVRSMFEAAARRNLLAQLAQMEEMV